MQNFYKSIGKSRVFHVEEFGRKIIKV
jgi:hypothetical protein